MRTISDDFGRNLRRLNCAGEVRSSRGSCHQSCSVALHITSTRKVQSIDLLVVGGSLACKLGVVTVMPAL